MERCDKEETVKKLLLVWILIAAPAQAEIYTWKDGRGTTHYTNSMVEIPARYKAKAKVLDLGMEQKDGQAVQPSGQPAGQPVPSPAPAAAAPAAPGAQVQVAPPTPSPVAVPERTTRVDRRHGVRRSRAASEED